VSDPIELAAAVALAGRLVVLPTDTVYGIGTRPDEPRATARLFEAKGRPKELMLPVLVPTTAAARRIAVFDRRAEGLALAFWAGPLTLVLPRAELSREWDLGDDPGTIGVRMPHHPLALALLARTGPLAVTSANRSSRPTPATCEGVEEVFGEVVEVYLGESDPLVGRASTVVELVGSNPRILREGSITEAEVRAVLGPRARSASPRTPR